MEVTTYPITASFLHPRYKQMKFIPESKRKIINHVNELIEYKHGEETRKSVQQDPVGKEREEAEDESMSVSHCLMGHVESNMASGTESANEITVYPLEPICIANPLEYWCHNESR